VAAPCAAACPCEAPVLRPWDQRLPRSAADFWPDRARVGGLDQVLLRADGPHPRLVRVHGGYGLPWPALVVDGRFTRADDRWRTRTTGQAAQIAQIHIGEVHPDTAFQTPGQHHAAITDADQTADRMTDDFEKTSHLAVSTFGDDHFVPVVHALAATVFDALESCLLAVDLHPLDQTGLGFRTQHTQRTHCVLTFDTEARMHQLIGQVA